MSSQPSQPPAIITDPPSQGEDATIPEIATLTISGEGDTLSPFATTNEKYSIVQPGVELTELQPELLGDLIQPDRPEMLGGHADVYKGRWVRPDGIRREIDVAIKVLRVVLTPSPTTSVDTLRRKLDIRMKRETLIWTRAIHPNIHTFLGFKMGLDSRLISPWCAQGNLHTYLVFNPSLSRIRKLRLINQAALGLAFLHGQTPPICHADIKPENILINDRDEAALSDFGVSRVLESLAEHTGLTTTGGGGAIGTYPYTAPELFNPMLLGQGNSVPKPSCEGDVYAFGGLILAVMSGKAPFHGVHKPMIMMKIVQGETPKSKDHHLLAENDPLWVVMNSCWKFKLSARLSMNDVLEKIKEIALNSCSEALYVGSVYSVGCWFRLM